MSPHGERKEATDQLSYVHVEGPIPPEAVCTRTMAVAEDDSWVEVSMRFVGKPSGTYLRASSAHQHL